MTAADAKTVTDDTSLSFAAPVKVLQQQEQQQQQQQPSPQTSPAQPDPAFIVNWDGPDDPDNPHNWSLTYKWFLTLLMGLLTLNSSFTSSLPSGNALESMIYFHVSQEVITLAITAYVIGIFALGPILWAPLSEHVGRYPTFVISLTCYTAWNLGCGLCHNIGSLIVFRLLAGSFAACPLTNAAAVLADIWDANMRGTAMALFAVAPFAGPALGPTVSGAISVTGTSWRWTYYVATMFSGACAVLATLCVKETYVPVLLARRAKKLRKETGDDRYVARIELNRVSPKELVTKVLCKPFVLLFQEPMLLAITLYTGYIYGILYMTFEAFPMTFGSRRGNNALISGLCFLPFFVGGLLVCGATVVYYNPAYVKKAKQSKTGMLEPESRLPMTYLGGPFITISIFWLGWTCFTSISIWSGLIATSLLGAGFILVFQGLFNYIIDAYLINAATAMAANTVIRSAFGAGFPLFTSQMFNKLNLHWGYTLVGCLSALMLPIPFILGLYGPKLRAMSKNTMTPAQVAMMLGMAPPPRATPTDEESGPSDSASAERELKEVENSIYPATTGSAATEGEHDVDASGYHDAQIKRDASLDPKAQAETRDSA